MGKRKQSEPKRLASQGQATFLDISQEDPFIQFPETKVEEPKETQPRKKRKSEHSIHIFQLHNFSLPRQLLLGSLPLTPTWVLDKDHPIFQSQTTLTLSFEITLSIEKCTLKVFEKNEYNEKILESEFRELKFVLIDAIPFLHQQVQITLKNLFFSLTKVPFFKKKKAILIDINLRSIHNLAELDIYLTKNSLFEASNQWESSKIDNKLAVLINHFFPSTIPSTLIQNEFSISEFYSAIKRERFVPTIHQPEELNPHITLRPYQLRAIEWMIQRENNTSTSIFHPMWIELSSKDGTLFYYSIFSKKISLQKIQVNDIAGGILGDEMGLGKTLEVIGLILLNERQLLSSDIEMNLSPMKNTSEPKPSSAVCTVCGSNKITKKWIQCDECSSWVHSDCTNSIEDKKHYCDNCTSFPVDKIVQSKTTLIICPNSILYQWYNEIQNHVKTGALRVLIYKGIREHFFTPTKLSQYDIILTTYEAMRADLYHLPKQERTLRYEKSYKIIYTPLKSIEFFRICLDECQMIESPAKIVGIIGKLNSVHRWCVSGTPIQRGLEDLFYLFHFLQIAPYSQKKWFRSLIQDAQKYGSKEEMKQVYQFLRHFIWRNSKEDILDELQIPDQSEETIFLNFSPVESYFYNKQKDQCTLDLRSQLSKLARQRLNAKRKAKLYLPLLKLRQACNHPQIANKMMGTLQKTAMTMDQLLDQLISKAKVEEEEARRQLACAMNGLAAIHIIEKNIDEAISVYSEILKLEKPGTILDSLQKIHTLHNLYQILQETSRKEINISSDSTNPEKLDLNTVYSMLEQLKSKYIKNAKLKVEIALHGFKTAKKQFQESFQDFDSSWFASACSAIQQSRMEKSFLLKLYDELTNEFKYNLKNDTSIISQFRDLNGLLYVLESYFQRLTKARSDLETGLETISKSSLDIQLARFSSCPKCSKRKTDSPLCLQCETHSQFEAYERLLFSSRTFKVKKSNNVGDIFVDEENQEETQQILEIEESEEARENTKKIITTRADSEFERSLKTINMFLRTLKQNEEIEGLLESAKKQFEIFEQQKKEFKAFRQLWQAQKDLVYALDELDMAITKLQLRAPNEKVSETEKAFKLLPIEVPSTKLKLQTDRSLADINLRKATGQMKYLEYLQAKDKNFENESCVICLETIGPQQVMLPCGHIFCEQCISSIMKKAKFTIKCPQCRNRVNVSEVSCIIDHKMKENPSNANSNKEEVNEDEEIEVKGSYGTKLESIVKRLLKINKLDGKAKTLIFSEWIGVLDILAQALIENGISFVKLDRKKNFQRNIDQFKSDEQIRVLLLPTKTGANGLNLIEASYVFLVEPALSAGVEEQAVNRIHRIGQIRPTKVYHFVIKNTIEEKINILGKRRYSSGIQELKHQESSLSIQELKSLFNQDDEGVANIPTEKPILIDSGTEKENSESRNEIEEVQNTKKDSFWGGSIFYNNSMIPRHRAVVQMECLHSWELKDVGKVITQEPHIDLFGRTVPIVVAQWILNLSSSNPNENPKLLEDIVKLQEKVNAIVKMTESISTNESSSKEEFSSMED